MLLARDGAKELAARELAALREAVRQHGSRWPMGVAAVAVPDPPRQCRRSAAGAGQREGESGEPAHGGAYGRAVAVGAAQRCIGGGEV